MLKSFVNKITEIDANFETLEDREFLKINMV
jgi:hypothetical protein